VRPVGIRARFLKEEGGFTLPEMLVTIMIMTIVLFALGSIFSMSVRVFSYGSNKVEAVESARIGMEKMEREIRAAYPVNVNDATPYLFFSADGTTSNPPQAMPDPAQITFGNERGAEGGGNGQIDCPAPDNCEYITYKLSAPSNEAPCAVSDTGCSTLLRVNTDDSSDTGDPVSENAVVPGGLTFEYLKSDGDPATSEGEIAKVRVSLDIAVDPGTNYEASQRLTTEIDLRNRQ
jgi:prepilin-type N-terminal cleavage/methylation domain-containing protein